MAEDSACLEDDPFTWKLLLWPGPFDADITVDLIETWRDELIEEGKLVPYFVGGRRFFFIEPFHRHEHPRNPQINDLPLPPWVSWVPSEKDRRKGLYKMDWAALEAYLTAQSEVVQPLNEDCTSVVQGLSPARPALPCPALPGPARSLPERGAADAPPDDSLSGEPQTDEKPPTTQTIVAFAVEYCQEHGYDLDDGVKNHLAGVVRKQFRAGKDPALIRDGVEELLEMNKSPAQLPWVMGDIQRRRSGGGTGKHRGNRRTDSSAGRSLDGEW